MDRRGQSWSMDAVLGVVIFGFVSVAITSFALLGQSDVAELQRDAQRVSTDLAEPGPCGVILANETLSNETLTCLFQLDYESAKEQFRFDSDFCVYIEDEQGQLITVANRTGWGSDALEVGGFPCGQQFS